MDSRRHAHRCAGVAVMVVLGGLLVAAVRQTPPPPATRPAGEKNMMKITSTAFEPNQPIPRKYTGEGDDASPPLAWTGAPAGTKEFALICDDPDAPRKDPWVHWVIYKLPPTATSLKENIEKKQQPAEPAGALQGPNSAGKPGYHGPMPPPGHGVHRYFFRLYALDTTLDENPGLTKEQLLAAMKGHVLAEAELIGTYERKKQQRMTPVALTIAGSDPSGGAGLQADLKTFHQHGVYGMSVVTLLTVQNTQQVSAVEVLSADFVLAQLDAVLADIPPAAAKTGALGSAAVIEAVAERAKDFAFPLVVDPVMVSKHGDPLIDPEAAAVLRRKLVPRAKLVTPNIFEAKTLAEMEIGTIADMEHAAGRIARLGVANVLIKGGALGAALGGTFEEALGGAFEGKAVDVLWSGGELHRFASPRIDTPHTHGTGCVYSAAITARLARGDGLLAAVQGAKAFVTAAIRSAPQLGKGRGPVNMCEAGHEGSEPA